MNLYPCGTPAAYRRHLRAREKTCPECRRAHADAVNTLRMSYRSGTVTPIRRARRLAYAQVDSSEATG